MQKSQYLKAIVLGAFLFVLAACGDNTDNASTGNGDNQIEKIETIHVKTTLYPLEDFTNRIGGEFVKVDNIVPVGADAHTFEPTANQMIEVAEADLFIYNGADFEGFADSIKDTVASHDVTVVTASEGIDLISYDHDHDDHDHSHDNDHHHDHENDHDADNHNHSHNHDESNVEHHDHNDNEENHSEDDHDHSHGEEDPHVWLDPIRSIQLAENIKEALIDINPEEQETFEANFETLKEELEKLDEELQTMSESADRSMIVVSHAGYGYWEDRYGIEQIAIAGLSPSNEPSIQQIQTTISLMEDHDINYVMFEQNIPTNLAETVKNEVGAEDVWLHNLEALTEEDIENNENYFSLMRRNIEALETVLN
ncbi:zinc ABC transporter substrate-binding protein [Salipaludibacillus sp. LMS25]|jgi:zinc transport system substrate-binding protein|uniref:metal ABC transporter solute-binding protein, Zn/Mn family n=1 Tax=Salipaludibacillus sp. LMS25 TaxID=2924031 RepID=UPI0020D0BE13|nr:zinc ABC transporter substrate-binding protein [Salipaludibacillus sp. LMS25]UTR14513.1 zinc ABC transporter substrate-binding protein [Salipaludibacillus sp. LMS25]